VAEQDRFGALADQDLFRPVRGFANKAVDVRQDLVDALDHRPPTIGAAVAGQIEGQRRSAGTSKGLCHVVVAVGMFPKTVHDDDRRLGVPRTTHRRYPSFDVEPPAPLAKDLPTLARGRSRRANRTGRAGSVHKPGRTRRLGHVGRID